MPIDPSNKPNVSRDDTFKPEKGYTKVKLNMGKPLVAADFNDAVDALNHSASQHMRADRGYALTQDFAREWQVQPVEASDPASLRNADNFAVTLGRLTTPFGILDTKSMSEDGLSESVIFDYTGISVLGGESPEDRQFANVMFRGQVTAVGTSNELVDENKAFTDNHRLAGVSDLLTVPGGPIAPGPFEPAYTVGDWVIEFEEPACNVIFLTGANTGNPYLISSRVSATTLGIDQGFLNPVNVGDEYVIVPGNALDAQRTHFNSTTNANESNWVSGKAGAYTAVLNVMVWEEDISPDEDPELEHPSLPEDVSHRTKLSWCIRTTNIRMSADGTGGGGTTLAPLHVRKMLSGAYTSGGVRADMTRDMLNDGDHVLTGEIDDGQRFSAGWATDAVRSWADPFQGAPESGLTRAHQYVNSKYQTFPSQYWNGYNQLLPEAVSAAMEAKLVSQNAPAVHHVLLMMTAPHSRTVGGTGSEPLHPSFHPGLAQEVGNPPANHARLATYPNTYKEITGSGGEVEPGFVWTAIPQLMSVKEMGYDISVGRGVAANNHDGPILDNSAGQLFAQVGLQQVPLLYGSLAEHFAALDTAVLGITGLGNQLGRTNLNYDDDGAATRISSSKNFLFKNAQQSLFQSGQSSDKYRVGSQYQLNPMASAQGSVHAIDPLVGTDTGKDIAIGEFVSGPGGYYLRDGTFIEVDSEDGWSHYMNDDLGVTGGNNPFSDTTRRKFEDGKAQAIMARDSLNFRKLAVKTSAHGEMDMFNYWIGDPNAITGPGATRAKSSMGLIQDATGAQNDAAASPENFQSYGETWDNTGDAGVLTNGKGSKSIEDATSDIKVDEQNGPWSRYALLPTDMKDVWENRNTTFRLRYHIGDFYPGPDGEEAGTKVNALVDTLNLYVRFDPLPLVHWATMPKHQHPALEASMSNLSGLDLFLDYLEGLGTTDHLLYFNEEPLVTETSPDAVGNGGTATVGDVDVTSRPFADKYQPFTHWYHPNMEHIEAPRPYESTGTGNNEYPGPATRYSVYAKWGERSLIIPSVVHNPSALRNKTSPDAQSTSTIDNFKASNNDADASEIMGSHYSMFGDTGDEHDMQMPDSTQVTVSGSDGFFPFVPEVSAIDPLDRTATAAEGYPGPVFVPAFRQYSGADADLDSNVDFHPLFKVRLDGYENEYAYWPDRDVVGTDSDSGDYFLYGRGSNDTDSSFDWSFPVMRAHISTPTVAGIVDLVRTKFAWDGSTIPNNALNKPGAGPEMTTDTSFVGDLGTSVNIDPAGLRERTSYLHPLVFSIPVDKTTLRPMQNAHYSEVYHDMFELAHAERTDAYGAGSDPTFAPLINTFKAVQHMGLAQKLLWNCSFRVLHTRPGGGQHSGMAFPLRSSKPKSLTELFVVRDRAEGVAKPMPKPPNAPEDKPYLHFESMHPSASGGGSFRQHPNHAQLGHLYPMISDSLGANSAGAGRNLYTKTLLDGDTRLTGADFDSPEHMMSMTGDTYNADPFDYAYNNAQDSSAKIAMNDRQNQNSGIEIDLVSELRYVRENKAAHGIDQMGSFGESWADMIPTVEEMTGPGDHELMFVLYTGKFGQQMVDSTVPNGFNPPFCGCRITASIEVNRPSEKNSSANGGTGEHYGLSLETYNVLGDS